jgi:hypothetical protein
MRKPKKLCPKCGLEGSGPYARWVLNPIKKRYEPYYYFAHKREGKIKWCYLGRLSNKVPIIGTESDSPHPHRCVDCANLTQDNFCIWQGAYIKKEELLTQTFECEGFKPKPRKLSNSKGCGRKVLHFEAKAANFHRKRGLKVASGLRAKPAPPSHKTYKIL